MTARARRGEATVASRLDDIPFEIDREFIAGSGTKSVAILPMVIDGRFVGGVTFGAIRRAQEWTPDVIGRLKLVVEIIGSVLARKAADLELQTALAENERLRRSLERDNIYLQEELAAAQDFGDIVGRSPALRAVLHKVDQVAATDASVLLLGETGTGKELIARAIHTRSGRSGRPLITVNCAALPPSLIESELFGYEKGAFTGATQTRAGRFEIADGSTLFLDEIGDLDPALQAKMLRALQEGEISRLGASVARKVNVRIIAATNRDLVRRWARARSARISTTASACFRSTCRREEQPVSEKLADAERAHILAVLRQCAWRIEGPGQAAVRLGLRPSTLRNRMRKLGVRRPNSAIR